MTFDPDPVLSAVAIMYDRVTRGVALRDVAEAVERLLMAPGLARSVFSEIIVLSGFDEIAAIDNSDANPPPLISTVTLMWGFTVLTTLAD